MRTAIIQVSTSVFWLYFPILFIWLALYLVGSGSKALEGPELAFIASVMFGESIQRLSDIQKDDIWAYRIFSLVGFALSLLMATLVSLNKYTEYHILKEIAIVDNITTGLILGAIMIAFIIRRFETVNITKA